MRLRAVERRGGPPRPQGQDAVAGAEAPGDGKPDEGGRPLIAPAAMDAGIAAGVAFLGVASALGARHQHEHVPVGAIVILGGMGLVLFLRRRLPGLVLTVMAVLVTALVMLRTSLEAGFVAVLVASYSAAVYGRRRLAVGVAAAAAVVLATTIVADAVGAGDWLRARVPLATLLAAAGAWVVGLVIRRQFAVRAAQLDLLRQRAELTAGRQREQARRAALTERLRIARELHDIVAHHISVVVIQAQGAQRMLERDPVRTKNALAVVEQTGRTALEEMRRMLGLLRSGEQADPGDGSAEQGAGEKVPPGLAGIDALAERMRAAGLDVTVHASGEPPAVPDDVGLAAYRIVQEALTNSLKHAGSARVTVRLDFTGGLDIVVEDDGRGAAAHLSGTGVPGAGRGITGMRERAAAAGGSLTLGPRPGGGFRVHATIPLADS